MKRPKTVKIGKAEFKVEYVKKVRDGIVGEVHLNEQLIRVEDNAQWFPVLFHEMMHAALHVSRKNRRLSVKMEESIVLALEEHLAPLLKLR